MTALPQGILLPQSLLSSPAFIVFSTFVALNTIVYLGLTLSKFVPWPPQMRPARVRAVLPSSFAKDVTMNTLSKEQRQEIADPITAARSEYAQRTIPLAFIFTGGVVILSSLLSLFLIHEPGVWQYIGEFGGGLLLIAFGQVAARRRIPGNALSWIWAVATTAIVAEVTWNAVLKDSTVDMVYAIVAMTALTPVAMSWRPALVGGIVSLAVVIGGGIIIDQIASLPWILAAITSIIIGAVLLYLRIAGIDALTLEQMRSNRLATTDPLTGLLTRAGLLSIAQSIVGTAERTNEPVGIVLLDVVDMRGINADYGVEYGDAVLQVLARALEAVMPAGDLPCRWSGDDFLVLGVGQAPPPAQVAAQVEEQLAASGVGLGKRPILVRAGSATGSPSGTTLQELQAQAEASLATGQLATGETALPVAATGQPLPEGPRLDPSSPS